MVCLHLGLAGAWAPLSLPLRRSEALVESKGLNSAVQVELELVSSLLKVMLRLILCLLG